jgi:hypothetical protein
MFRNSRWIAAFGAIVLLAVAAGAGCQASRLLRQPYHEPATLAVAPG